MNRWHRVDAVETWHWYAGDALELAIASEAGVSRFTLGPRLSFGHRPQAVVPLRAWQSARPLGAYGNQAILGASQYGAVASMLALTNAEATERNVRIELNDFLRQASAEDLIVIFLAGHGVQDNEQNLYVLEKLLRLLNKHAAFLNCACPKCGYYKGREVLEMEESK